MPFRYGVLTDKGRERAENQDRYAVNLDIGLFVLADGMGGCPGGSSAAAIVVEDLPVSIETALRATSSSRARTIRAVLGKAILEQNRQLCLESQLGAGPKGMGSTLVLALLKDSRAYMANLGDSRAYRYRNGRLTQFTKDHDVLSELAEQGAIGPEEVENHIDQGVLSQYMGMDERPLPLVRSFQLKSGDRLLLCTDGLSGMVDGSLIASILGREAEPDAAGAALVEAANAAGGSDNITVAIIDWTGR